MSTTRVDNELLDKVKGLVEGWRLLSDTAYPTREQGMSMAPEQRYDIEGRCEQLDVCADQLAAILPELEAMARDAERWRMVRNGHSDYYGDCYAMTFDPDGDYPVVGHDLDNRVDRMVARVKAQDFPGYDAAIDQAQGGSDEVTAGSKKNK